jgi:hypothetical protein
LSIPNANALEKNAARVARVLTLPREDEVLSWYGAQGF